MSTSAHPTELTLQSTHYSNLTTQLISTGTVWGACNGTLHSDPRRHAPLPPWTVAGGEGEGGARCEQPAAHPRRTWGGERDVWRPCDQQGALEACQVPGVLAASIHLGLGLQQLNLGIWMVRTPWPYIALSPT